MAICTFAAIVSRLNLVLDIGNTQAKLAVFQAKTLVQLERVQHNQLVNAARELLGTQPQIDACVLSSVINHPAALEDVLRANARLLVLDADTPLPITNGYATPRTLGRDRLAAAVGLHSLYPHKNALSIDCGTCITYDVLTAEGTYLGGGISPGLEMRFKAVHTFTDHLPLVARQNVPPLVGDNTQSAIASGVINGVVAEIQGIIGQYQAQFPGLVVALTGGDVEFFEKALKNPIFAHPNLVLTGLNSILSFNDSQDI